MKTLKVLKYIGFGILGLIFIFGSIWITMLLWNSLIPALFHGPVISYWQTAGLFILSKILLTGIAPGRQGHKPGKEWQKRYHEKFESHCQEHKANEAASQA